VGLGSSWTELSRIPEVRHADFSLTRVRNLLFQHALVSLWARISIEAGISIGFLAHSFLPHFTYRDARPARPRSIDPGPNPNGSFQLAEPRFVKLLKPLGDVRMLIH
jgi:hypothetical protein